MPDILDQFFYFSLGFSSFFLTYILIQWTKHKDQYYVIIILVLFSLDFGCSLHYIITADS